MTDHPMTLCCAMLNALVDGRKFQHRVMLIPQPNAPNTAGVTWDDTYGWIGRSGWDGSITEPVTVRYNSWDLIWVKEDFTLTQYNTPVYRADAKDKKGDRWQEIESGDPHNEVLWESSNQMPRWASRLTLLITDVWVERLQEITDEDAKMEGCSGFCSPMHPDQGVTDGQSPSEEFHEAWNGIHGPAAWDQNPWVAVLSFKVMRGNIDQLENTE